MAKPGHASTRQGYGSEYRPDHATNRRKEHPVKRIAVALAALGLAAAALTACNFPTFAEWCTEEGGTVQDTTEPDGDVEPHCMKDGKSIGEEEDYYGEDDLDTGSNPKPPKPPKPVAPKPPKSK